MKFKISFNCWVDKKPSLFERELIRSRAIKICHDFPSGTILYGLRISCRINLLVFLPVVEQVLYSTSLNTFLRIRFWLSFNCCLKFRNLLRRELFMCTVSDRGSRKYLWVSLGRESINLIDTFQVFSNFVNSDEEWSHNGEP